MADASLPGNQVRLEKVSLKKSRWKNILNKLNNGIVCSHLLQLLVLVPLFISLKKIFLVFLVTEISKKKKSHFFSIVSMLLYILVTALLKK